MSAYRSAGDIFVEAMSPIYFAIMIAIILLFLIILGIGVLGYRYIVPQSERTTLAYIMIIIISVSLTWWRVNAVYLKNPDNLTQNALIEQRHSLYSIESALSKIK